MTTTTPPQLPRPPEAPSAEIGSTPVDGWHGDGIVTRTPGTLVARTGGQAGAAAFLVVILVWLGRLAGLDLDPDGPGTSPPAEVVVAATGLLTVAGSAVMNLRRRRNS